MPVLLQKPAVPASHRGPIVAFLIFVLVSPSQALSPFGFMAACVLLLVVLARNAFVVRVVHLVLAGALLLVAAAGLAWRFEASSAVRVVITCLLLPMVGSIDLRRCEPALRTILRLLLATLVLSLIGFVYALAGGPPLLTLTNPDGREALLFLSTLSNSVFPAGAGFLIRPSFIYDEPGAYAFVIDAALLLNFLIRRRLDRLDYWVITGGILTFSLAHILVSVLLLIGARRTWWLVAPAAFLAMADFLLYRISDVSLVLDRLTISDGRLAGDNRSELLDNAWALLTQNPTGVGSLCQWDIASCADRFGPFGENPAFPAAFYGLLPSAAYYVVLGMFVLAVVSARSRARACAAAAVVVLISQRPFMFNLGYNLLILLLFGLVLRRARVSAKSRPQPHCELSH